MDRVREAEDAIRTAQVMMTRAANNAERVVLQKFIRDTEMELKHAPSRPAQKRQLGWLAYMQPADFGKLIGSFFNRGIMPVRDKLASLEARISRLEGKR